MPCGSVCLCNKVTTAAVLAEWTHHFEKQSVTPSSTPSLNTTPSLTLSLQCWKLSLCTHQQFCRWLEIILRSNFAIKERSNYYPGEFRMWFWEKCMFLQICERTSWLPGCWRLSWAESWRAVNCDHSLLCHTILSRKLMVNCTSQISSLTRKVFTELAY